MAVTPHATRVVHPAAEDVREPSRLAPRLATLQGTTLGLIDNHKRNADVYLEELGRLLQAHYGVARVVTYCKISQSLPTPAEALDHLARTCDALIHAVADWGSCTAWGLHDGIEVEKRGRAAVTVITHAFTHAAQQRAQALGLPAHPVVVVEHPLASKTRDQAQDLARHSLEAVVHGLVAHQEEPGRASPVRPPPRRARASHLPGSGTVSAMNDYLYDQGWTDGLPVIPPTPDLVAAMLEAAPLPAEEVLGTLPPRDGTVTVEKVASNAVMAGCQPAYFPVVLAAVKAVLQPQFNAGAITTTTGGAAPVVIISGPIAQQLGIHSGTAVLGSGHRPNATIGRALRLTMRNLGGATADTMEKSTHGWPGKYTMCFAENAARNPWEPLHVALGFAPEVSIVVVVAARGLITSVEASQETGLGNLETLVSAMRGEGISGYYYQARGASPIVVLGPEHAAEIAAAGMGRHAVKEYIFQHARMPLGSLRDRGHWGARSWPEAWEHQPDDFPVPLVTDPDKLIVVVAGGDGRHSSWFPAWSATQRAMEVIETSPEWGPRAGAPSPCG